MRETKSTCPYCGVGCGVIIESIDDNITGVRGDPAHPANFGRLCSKGSNLHLTASPDVIANTRLLYPMQRLQRDLQPERVTWDHAFDTIVNKVVQVITDHGPDALGFYLSGQLLTEDYYVFNKLVKGLIGTNNVDSNSRLCMSSAVAGYKQTLGADAPPTCYEDIDHADCLFIAGSNPAFAHPILFRRIEDAKAKNPALKIIVVDPRRTDSVELADVHLKIKAGTDVMLFNGMLHIMLQESWLNHGFIARHTVGFDVLQTTVGQCTPEITSKTCGISIEDLYTAARLFATSKASLSLYCQGLNQSSSGTMKNAALINLHLATGQIGRAGAGPFSLTGQPNAMGGREVGGMANLLSSHRDMGNPVHRAEIAKLWGVSGVPAKPGKTAVEMFQAVADGDIKVLWIACTNPAQSMPHQALVRQALQRAELVIVQDAFHTTATCAYADILLPASTWGEKEGTVTNSERRISRVRAAVRAPGEARHDWSIAAEFAKRLELRLPKKSSTAMFDFASAESVWHEHRESTRGRDLDITGMSYALLENSPLQWPMRVGDVTGKARLYEDYAFATSDGKARLVNTPYSGLAEVCDLRFPLSLNTGRLRDQWHGMSRSGTVSKLFSHAPEPVVQMNASTMAEHSLADGDLVHITSKRGSLVLPVQASKELDKQQVFLAMHWGAEYLGGQSNHGEALMGVNALTTSVFCPTSKQPELKHAAVKVLKAELPWSLAGMALFTQDVALRAQQALQRLMRQFPYASCVPFEIAPSADGPQQMGVLFRAAAYEAPDQSILNEIESLLGLGASSDNSQVLRFTDKKKGQSRSIKLQGDRHFAKLNAFVLAGDSSSYVWMKTLLQERLAAHTYGQLLLMPGAKAPVAVPTRGKAVCTCFNVSELDINNYLATCDGTSEERLTSLQSSLKCGSNCGSCVPEIKRLVRLTESTPA